jgi:hypothetical protein
VPRCAFKKARRSKPEEPPRKNSAEQRKREESAAVAPVHLRQEGQKARSTTDTGVDGGAFGLVNMRCARFGFSFAVVALAWPFPASFSFRRLQPLPCLTLLWGDVCAVSERRPILFFVLASSPPCPAKPAQIH